MFYILLGVQLLFLTNLKLSCLLSDLDSFAAIIKRETDKEDRAKQNEFLKELDPLIFSLHLGKGFS